MCRVDSSSSRDQRLVNLMYMIISTPMIHLNIVMEARLWSEVWGVVDAHVEGERR